MIKTQMRETKQRKFQQFAFNLFLCKKNEYDQFCRHHHIMPRKSDDKKKQFVNKWSEEKSALSTKSDRANKAYKATMHEQCQKEC